MPIPSEIRELIDRLQREIDETEQQAIGGLNQVRQQLLLSPENEVLVSFFAYFNTILFFLQDARRQIQITEDSITPEDVTPEEMQEAGEDLGTILGRVIESKIGVSRIINRLENLP